MPTDLGRLGVWAALDALSAEESSKFANQLEAWGYTALWTPEAVGRDPFAFIGFLAGRTEKLVFATGIANIYARDPMTFKGIHQTIEELAPSRFVLGLGVSHAHLVSKVRGHEYKKPLTTMRNFLESMESALYMGTQPKQQAPIVIAALRDKMLELAATKTAGAHPYLTPPEHTERARKVMGPDAWLCPEQMVILESDASKAREIARKHLAVYTRLPNYQNNLKQFGFEDADFEDGGSDKLVDGIVAWGDEQAIRDRLEAHYKAGANHVCIQAFRPDGEMSPDLNALEVLAPARA